MGMQVVWGMYAEMEKRGVRFLLTLLQQRMGVAVLF